MADSTTYDHLLKLLLVGDSNVGKTSLLLSFTSDSFKENVRNTVGVDLKVKIVKHPGTGKTLKLTIWDTAGQERFRTLTSAYYRGAHGVILVYDVTNRESFQNIKHWLNEVELYSTNDDVIKMLVGNKIDLAESDSSGRQVSRSEGASFARQNGMLFIEASAKTQVGVKDAFNELCSKVLERPSLIGSSKSSTQQQGAGLRLTEENQSGAGRGCASCITG